MATWTNVSSTVLEPGDPIRSVDIIAIKENVIALSEGASGAPKILTAAINDAAVTTAKLATGTNERDWVLARTAGASVGAVGTYAFLRHGPSADYAPGATLAGSSLVYTGVGTINSSSYTATSSIENVTFASPVGSTVSGTWRCMGVGSNTTVLTTDGAIPVRTASLWLRIS